MFFPGRGGWFNLPELLLKERFYTECLVEIINKSTEIINKSTTPV